MKLKMAATAGLSLTLVPMEKVFQNASSLKPLCQLSKWFQRSVLKYFHIGPMSIYVLRWWPSWISDRHKKAATAGLSLTLVPMEKMFQNASSLKPLGQVKPNCPGMIIGREEAF
jgi:hypothetical protein